MEGLSYCPVCGNYFFRAGRTAPAVPDVLRALVELSGFPDVLNTARAAHIAAVVAWDDPRAEALLTLAASGIRPQEELKGEGTVSPEEREEALASRMAARAHLPAETALSLARCFSGALMLRDEKSEGES